MCPSECQQSESMIENVAAAMFAECRLKFRGESLSLFMMSQENKTTLRFLSKACFCLRPSAKDQGIT